MPVPNQRPLSIPRKRFNVPIPSASLGDSRTREYRPGLVPAPSPFRPHCASRDRLRLWRPSPPPTNSTAASGYVPSTPEAAERILDLLSSAWAPGTKSAYGAGLLVFHVFCDARTPPVPEHLRGPASDLLVLEFISWCAGTLRGKTLKNYAYGVKAWHTVHGLGWVLDDTRITAALVAAERVSPASSKRPQRPPLLVATISAIRDRLDI
ncbi:hypothetical protein BJ912DRAFT_853217, partial [Pholiota molesta]